MAESIGSSGSLQAGEVSYDVRFDTSKLTADAAHVESKYEAIKRKLEAKPINLKWEFDDKAIHDAQRKIDQLVASVNRKLDSINPIKIKLDTGEFDKKISEVEKRLAKIGATASIGISGSQGKAEQVKPIDTLRYPLLGSGPNQFKYQGSGSDFSTRTVLPLLPQKDQKNLLTGYEIQSGSTIHTLQQAPVKSYRYDRMENLMHQDRDDKAAEELALGYLVGQRSGGGGGGGQPRDSRGRYASGPQTMRQRYQQMQQEQQQHTGPTTYRYDQPHYQQEQGYQQQQQQAVRAPLITPYTPSVSAASATSWPTGRRRPTGSQFHPHTGERLDAYPPGPLVPDYEGKNIGAPQSIDPSLPPPNRKQQVGNGTRIWDASKSVISNVVQTSKWFLGTGVGRVLSIGAANAGLAWALNKTPFVIRHLTGDESVLGHFVRQHPIATVGIASAATAAAVGLGYKATKGVYDWLGKEHPYFRIHNLFDYTSTGYKINRTPFRLPGRLKAGMGAGWDMGSRDETDAELSSHAYEQRQHLYDNSNFVEKGAYNVGKLIGGVANIATWPFRSIGGLFGASMGGTIGGLVGGPAGAAFGGYAGGAIGRWGGRLVASLETPTGVGGAPPAMPPPFRPTPPPNTRNMGHGGDRHNFADSSNEMLGAGTMGAVPHDPYRAPPNLRAGASGTVSGGGGGSFTFPSSISVHGGVVRVHVENWPGGGTSGGGGGGGGFTPTMGPFPPSDSHGRPITPYGSGPHPGSPPPTGESYYTGRPIYPRGGISGGRPPMFTPSPQYFPDRNTLYGGILHEMYQQGGHPPLPPSGPQINPSGKPMIFYGGKPMAEPQGDAWLSHQFHNDPFAFRGGSAGFIGHGGHDAASHKSHRHSLPIIGLGSGRDPGDILEMYNIDRSNIDLWSAQQELQDWDNLSRVDKPFDRSRKGRRKISRQYPFKHFQGGLGFGEPKEGEGWWDFKTPSGRRHSLKANQEDHGGEGPTSSAGTLLRHMGIDLNVPIGSPEADANLIRFMQRSRTVHTGFGRRMHGPDYPPGTPGKDFLTPSGHAHELQDVAMPFNVARAFMDTKRLYQYGETGRASSYRNMLATEILSPAEGKRSLDGIDKQGNAFDIAGPPYLRAQRPESYAESNHPLDASPLGRALARRRSRLSASMPSVSGIKERKFPADFNTLMQINANAMAIDIGVAQHPHNYPMQLASHPTDGIYPNVPIIPGGDERYAYNPNFLAGRDTNIGYDRTIRPNRGRTGDIDSAKLAMQLQFNGGFTFQPWTRQTPQKGYAVATRPDAGHAFPMAGSAMFDEVRAYMAGHSPELNDNPSLYMGGWSSKGAGYLDLAHVTRSEKEARALAIQHGQQAYYDLKNKREIFVTPRKFVESKELEPHKSIIRSKYNREPIEGALSSGDTLFAQPSEHEGEEHEVNKPNRNTRLARGSYRNRRRGMVALGPNPSEGDVPLASVFNDPRSSGVLNYSQEHYDTGAATRAARRAGVSPTAADDFAFMGAVGTRIGNVGARMGDAVLGAGRRIGSFFGGGGGGGLPPGGIAGDGFVMGGAAGPTGSHGAAGTPGHPLSVYASPMGGGGGGRLPPHHINASGGGFFDNAAGFAAAAGLRAHGGILGAVRSFASSDTAGVAGASLAALNVAGGAAQASVNQYLANRGEMMAAPRDQEAAAMNAYRTSVEESRELRALPIIGGMVGRPLGAIGDFLHSKGMGFDADKFRSKHPILSKIADPFGLMPSIGADDSPDELAQANAQGQGVIDVGKMLKRQASGLVAQESSIKVSSLRTRHKEYEAGREVAAEVRRQSGVTNRENRDQALGMTNNPESQLSIKKAYDDAEAMADKQHASSLADIDYQKTGAIKKIDRESNVFGLQASGRARAASRQQLQDNIDLAIRHAPDAETAEHLRRSGENQMAVHDMHDSTSFNTAVSQASSARMTFEGRHHEARMTMMRDNMEAELTPHRGDFALSKQIRGKHEAMMDEADKQENRRLYSQGNSTSRLESNTAANNLRMAGKGMQADIDEVVADTQQQLKALDPADFHVEGEDDDGGKTNKEYLRRRKAIQESGKTNAAMAAMRRQGTAVSVGSGVMFGSGAADADRFKNMQPVKDAAAKIDAEQGDLTDAPGRVGKKRPPEGGEDGPTPEPKTPSEMKYDKQMLDALQTIAKNSDMMGKAQ